MDSESSVVGRDRKSSSSTTVSLKLTPYEPPPPPQPLLVPLVAGVAGALPTPGATVAGPNTVPQTGASSSAGNASVYSSLPTHTSLGAVPASSSTTTLNNVNQLALAGVVGPKAGGVIWSRNTKLTPPTVPAVPPSTSSSNLGSDVNVRAAAASSAPGSEASPRISGSGDVERSVGSGVSAGTSVSGDIVVESVAPNPRPLSEKERFSQALFGGLSVSESGPTVRGKGTGSTSEKVGVVIGHSGRASSATAPAGTAGIYSKSAASPSSPPNQNSGTANPPQSTTGILLDFLTDDYGSSSQGASANSGSAGVLFDLPEVPVPVPVPVQVPEEKILEAPTTAPPPVPLPVVSPAPPTGGLDVLELGKRIEDPYDVLQLYSVPTVDKAPQTATLSISDAFASLSSLSPGPSQAPSTSVTLPTAVKSAIPGDVAPTVWSRVTPLRLTTAEFGYRWGKFKAEKRKSVSCGHKTLGSVQDAVPSTSLHQVRSRFPFEMCSSSVVW